MKIKALVILIVAAFLLFGCTQTTTDNQNTTAAQTGTTVNTNPNGPDYSPNDTPGTTDVTTTPDTTTAASDAFSTFQSLVSGLPEYQVSYTMTSQGQTINTTQYLKDTKMRADTTAQGTSSSVYILPTGQYVCTQYSGSWTCIDTTSQTGDSINSGIAAAKANPDAYKSKITAAGTKTVLGIQTTCFEMKDTNYDYTYCLSPKGAPLYMSGTSGDYAFTYEATAYSETVADSVFELPATPQTYEIPSGYSGYN